MADLTAIILTKNEEKNIEECIKSIKNIVKRIVVVDSGSTDNTTEIAKKYGADVYYNKFEYYAKQFNWGIDNTSIDTKWILRLDADERLTPNLCDEIKKMLKLHENDNVNGFTMEAWLYFMGRKLKYGGNKKRKLMIFKRGIGRIEDRRRDAHTIISEGVSISLKEKFLHYDFKDLDSHISKYNWYATREMQDYIEYKLGLGNNDISDKTINKTRKKKFGIYYKSPMFTRAWMLFIYNYIFRLGFLDGKEGYMFHYYESYWYRYLVDSKIFEYEKMGKEFEELKSLGE